jgi:hypothetical protein
MRVRLALGFVVVLVVGCGGPRKFAPVSGTVTLDGKPLAGVDVSFQPIAPEGAIEAGVGSNGKTDKDGHFTLKAVTKQNGAVVGKHRVYISSLVQQAASSDERFQRGGPPLTEKIPTKYNANSKLEIEVPASGLTKADFALTSSVPTSSAPGKGGDSREGKR